MNVFISYSHHDRETAKSIYNIIERHGLNPMLDEKDISGGEVIDDKVKTLLSQAQVLIVVISPSSIKSPWVFYEIGRADDSGKKIIPYLTHPGLISDLPIFLQKRKHFNNFVDIEQFFAGLTELNLPDNYLLSLYLSGLTAVYKSRESVPEYFWYLIRDANTSVRAMFVSGNFLSAVTFENAIKRKASVNFKLLLFNPKLVEIRNQDLKDNEYKIQESEWDTILSTVQHFNNVTVRLYDEYPFWHLVIVDEDLCSVSFNPLGKLGYNESPVYVFKNNKLTGNLFSAFSNYYEIIWRSANAP